MTVAQILKTKGNQIISIHADATVAEAATLLAEKRIGAVLVLNADESLAGVFSERDFVKIFAASGADVTKKHVAEFMTRDVVTCTSADTISHVMTQMTEKRFRHLPVIDNGKLTGVVSIGDVVKEKISEAEHDADAMREYISTG